MNSPLHLTTEQIAAARLRILLDEKLGRQTPELVRRIAETARTSPPDTAESMPGSHSHVENPGWLTTKAQLSYATRQIAKKAGEVEDSSPSPTPILDQAAALTTNGKLQLLHENYRDAADSLAQANALYQQMDSHLGQVETFTALAEAFEGMGLSDDARELKEAARRLLQQIGRSASAPSGGTDPTSESDPVADR